MAMTYKKNLKHFKNNYCKLKKSPGAFTTLNFHVFQPIHGIVPRRNHSSVRF